jgi:hypothetical protein
VAPAAKRKTPASAKRQKPAAKPATERSAVAGFIDAIRHGEALGARMFAAWAAQCRTPALRSGLHMIAEREAFHARVFAARLRALGAAPARFPADAKGAALGRRVTDPSASDLDKVRAFNAYIGPPDNLCGPIERFAAGLEKDRETRAALRLHAADERSTLLWLQAMERQLAGNATGRAPKQG